MIALLKLSTKDETSAAETEGNKSQSIPTTEMNKDTWWNVAIDYDNHDKTETNATTTEAGDFNLIPSVVKQELRVFETRITRKLTNTTTAVVVANSTTSCSIVSNSNTETEKLI